LSTIESTLVVKNLSYFYTILVLFYISLSPYNFFNRLLIAEKFLINFYSNNVIDNILPDVTIYYCVYDMSFQ